MTEYKVDLTSLIKDMGLEIIMSDEQIDENGEVVKEPVVVFAKGGERIGYIPIMALQAWIMHHIYAPEIKIREKDLQFPARYL